MVHDTCRTFLLLVFLLVLLEVKGDDSCIDNPIQSCANYTMPGTMVNNLISALCPPGMGKMPGCTVNSICSNNKYKDDRYCRNRFSVYKELCTDMPGMANCTSYKSMCLANETHVTECQAPALPLPSSSQCLSSVSTICSDPMMMGMAGCSKCSTNHLAMGLPCEVLQVYSELCLSMSNMPECAKWKAVCDLVPDWPICSYGGGTNMPPMRMYFHTGYLDYVLFEQWVPSNIGYYIATWLVVCLFAVFYEFFKLYRSSLERKWTENVGTEELEYMTINGEKTFYPRFRPRVDILRAFLHFLEVAWGMVIMLVVMTFNLGLFFAVCGGAFLGMLFVGRFLKYEPKAGCH